MKGRSTLTKGFEKVPVIGILRGYSLDDIKKIIPAFISAGLNTIEITMNTRNVTEIIQFISNEYGKELNVGAGTVCTMDDLEIALDAGAGFIVSPIVVDEIIHHCSDYEIPVFPGAFTPTEIYHAWEAGATMVKVYPVNFMGPKLIKNIKAPLEQIKLLPTGGIDVNNFSDYMKMGADGLGIGSGLFDKNLIKPGSFEKLKQHFEKFSNYFLK